MTVDKSGIKGQVIAELRRPDPKTGELKVVQREVINNLVTQVGDQMYGERGADLGSLAAPTGMRLGTGTTAEAKTGAGAAIVTYVTASHTAFNGSYPQTALEGGARRITYQATWDPGEATNSTINEVVITNEDPLTNVAGTAGNTISRAVFSSTIDKQAGDTLTVTWNHDLQGT